MKVDYHVHLEEGPYSTRWLQRTTDAIANIIDLPFDKHSKEWVEEVAKRTNQRLENGAFSSEWLSLYLLRAKQLGLKEVGIVDHLYRFREYRSYYEYHMDLEDSQLGNQQRKWLDQVSVASISDFITFIER